MKQVSTAEEALRCFGLSTLCVLALAGCAATRVGPDYAGPVATQAQAAPPSAWQAPLPHGGDAQDLARWWRQFDDPLLDTLIAAAQRESATVAQAAARIEQARAEAVAAGSSAWPSLDLSAQASRGTINIGTNILLANQARATAQASWEIDLFGRVARAREAADARVVARAADWHEARVSVAAEVANAWVEYRHCERLLQFAERDAASRTQTASATQTAADAGLQAPANAALARAGAAESRSRLIAQRADCERSIKALVALTAVPEETLRAQLTAGTARLPTPPRFALQSVPAELLRQRPDLAAAERAVAAASADIGRAEAERYPALSLTGSIGPLRLETGAGSATLSTWSIGPALSVPIFDAGRRRAQAEAARAVYLAAEADYRARARQAVREVEEALLRLASATEREADARTAALGYQHNLEAMQVRWRGGLADLLELEESRRLSLNADSTYAAVQRDQVSAWIALYRALGGGWTASNQDLPR